MYPYYVSTWKRVQLDEDDIAGMQQIYGAAKPGKFIPPEPFLPDIPPPPPVTTPPPEKGKVFDYCNISIHAIIKIRNLEFYIFKGPVSLIMTHPMHSVHRVNSYSVGRRFWLLADNMRMKDGFPVDGLPLTDLGLPSYVASVDAVFRWSENQIIYLFSGEYYWRLDDKAGRYGQVSQGLDYPRQIADTWRGVPTPVDAAFTGLNGKTIFFKDTQHYLFDNVAMRVHDGYPQPSALGILGCVRNE
ncbi:Matrix metallopeptidase 7 M10 family [Fasciola hepatica]|uniref:Matrix metallopeptidase 7 M10 family n=1 Tax=Fasciola hepatica TaxID=6192 RepID=A0A4E0RCZ3_FASHE|nr:Matrix metallopeptidase 7 M10 family [Fasciola hepatica]